MDDPIEDDWGTEDHNLNVNEKEHIELARGALTQLADYLSRQSKRKGIALKVLHHFTACGNCGK